MHRLEKGSIGFTVRVVDADFSREQRPEPLKRAAL